MANKIKFYKTKIALAIELALSSPMVRNEIEDQENNDD